MIFTIGNFGLLTCENINNKCESYPKPINNCIFKSTFLNRPKLFSLLREVKWARSSLINNYFKLNLYAPLFPYRRLNAICYNSQLLTIKYMVRNLRSETISLVLTRPNIYVVQYNLIKKNMFPTEKSINFTLVFNKSKL